MWRILQSFAITRVFILLWSKRKTIKNNISDSFRKSLLEPWVKSVYNIFLFNSFLIILFSYFLYYFISKEISVLYTFVCDIIFTVRCRYMNLQFPEELIKNRTCLSQLSGHRASIPHAKFRCGIRRFSSPPSNIKFPRRHINIHTLSRSMIKILFLKVKFRLRWLLKGILSKKP